jgi:Restriction endonuclease
MVECGPGLDFFPYHGHDDYHGHDNYRGHDKLMVPQLSNPNSPGAHSGREFEDLVANLFRQHGWRVKKESLLADKGADIVVSRGDQRYIIECKVASEGRPDRLVPLLSQAILQARAYAQAFPGPAAPLAVVGAPAISPSAANSLFSFLSQFAPDVAVGILDREGFRHFVGPGLEKLNASPPPAARRQKLSSPESAYLFSDLSQWMLKVLLAPLVPENLLRAPRGEYRNASELAAAAEVSVMSAFRFVRQLRQERFLDEHDEPLRLVRRKELLRRWQAAHLRGAPELALRWIIPVKREGQLPAALHAYSVQPNVQRELAPRACLGLFAAAESLGFGFVHGVPQYFYLESLDRDVLKRMGLSPEGAEHRPDVHVRVPAFRESLFRAAVLRDGVPVADILQVWLDVGSHPARGEEQAEEIRHRVLAPIFAEKR